MLFESNAVGWKEMLPKFSGAQFSLAEALHKCLVVMQVKLSTVQFSFVQRDDSG